VASNRLLLWGIAFELVFTAAVNYLPWLQDVFGTAALDPMQLAVIVPVPVLVWGADELVRAIRRRRTPNDARSPSGTATAAHDLPSLSTTASTTPHVCRTLLAALTKPARCSRSPPEIWSSRRRPGCVVRPYRDVITTFIPTGRALRSARS
jgi:Cation transporting ATPase, C-terminus